MLYPNEFLGYPVSVVNHYLRLEKWLIQDISWRIAQAGVTPTAKWQIEHLNETGKSLSAAKKEIAKTTGLATGEVNRLFHEAGIKSFQREAAIAKAAGKSIRMTEAQRMVIEAGIRSTNGQLVNFSKSMGFAGRSVQSYYNAVLDEVHIAVSSGTRSYQSAIRDAVKKMTNSGLDYVDYASGHRNRVDVATRRAVIGGLNYTTDQISLMDAELMGADGWETSAHMGARPSHEIWQGRQFAMRPNDLGYPLYDEVVGDQLNDANCRHSRFPIILGVSTPAYTDGERDGLDPPPFSYSGKEYTAYSASQKQRQIESGIRQTKRNLMGLESSISRLERSGADAGELREQYTATAIRLKNQNALYRDFSQAAGMKPQADRCGLSDWSRKEAGRATWTATHRTA